MKYLYGEEVKYEYDLLKLEDFELLQAFSCGNEKLDYYIHCELIHNEQIDTEDGLPFKVWNKDTGEIIAVFSIIWNSGGNRKLYSYSSCNKN